MLLLVIIIIFEFRATINSSLALLFIHLFDMFENLLTTHHFLVAFFASSAG